MRPELGDEVKLDGVLVKLVGEDVSGDVIVVMDVKNNTTQRVERDRFKFVGVAEFELQ